MKIRQQMIDALWHGKDPFHGFPVNIYEKDKQGWNSDHSYLVDIINQNCPRIVVEIGVWKGRSVIKMAEQMRVKKLDGVIIAVDTWLGSADHWMNTDFHKELRFREGYPNIYHCFASNVLNENLAEYVLPLPLDSINAAVVLRENGVMADVIHIDAGHDYASVYNDLSSWWSLLNEKGILICDDYHASRSEFHEVAQAIEDFLWKVPHSDFSAYHGKCKVVKEKE